MDEEAKALIRKQRAEYAREWRKRNPDKDKAIVQRYWLKKSVESLRNDTAKMDGFN